MKDSLEALERIYNDAISLNEIEEDVEKIEEDYNIIKQDLERLEKLEEEYNNLKKGIKIFLEYYDVYLFDEDGLGSCEIGVATIGEDFYISKKEYELLKGVFDDE